MLGKLLKHEFIATGRMIPMLYLATLLIAAVTVVTGMLDVGAVGVLSAVFLLLAGIVVIVVTYVVIIARFYKSVCSSEGYLTHTLPVSGGKIIASKLIPAFMWLVVSMGVMLAAIFGFILLIGNETGQDLFAIIGSAFDTFGVSGGVVWQYFAFFAGAVILQSLCFLAVAYFSMTLANIRPFQTHNAIVMSIVIYLTVNTIGQFISLALMLLLPFSMNFGVDGISLSFSQMSVVIVNGQSSVVGASIGMGAFVYQAAVSVILPVCASRLINKRFSIK